MEMTVTNTNDDYNTEDAEVDCNCEDGQGPHYCEELGGGWVEPEATWTEEEFEALVLEQLRRWRVKMGYEKEPAADVEAARAEKEAGRRYRVEMGWEKAPLSNECPHKPKTAKALGWALRILGVQVRHNLRRHATEYRLDGREWQGFNGRAIARITSDVEDTFTVTGYRDSLMPLKFGREAFKDCLDSLLYELEVDPFLDYLNGLPEPTGRRILPGLLERCFDVEGGQKELAAWASRAVPLGAVWRAYEPGTVFDEMVILCGPGDIGKTTFLRQMVPQHIPGLYGSSLDLAADPKAKVEALQGKVIVECGEMVGATRGDLAKIKDFLSRVDDGSVRLAYRKDPEDSPRRCVLVGTSDQGQFLARDPNPRRFVPIVLTGGKAKRVYKYMGRYHDRIFAEAKALYHKGISPRLPDTLKEAARNAAFKAMMP